MIRTTFRRFSPAGLRCVAVCLSLATLAASVPTANAIILQSKLTNSDQVFFAANASNSDLLHGLTGSHTGFVFPGERLNNGVHGVATDGGEIAWVDDAGATSTFDLGVGPNGVGWDLTMIRSIAAWNSADFHNQLYDVEIRRVGEVAFSPLVSVDHQPGGSSGSTQVTLTESSGVLAENVEEIRFNFFDASASVESTTYRELDVFGVASEIAVPEPGTGALLAAGFGLLAGYRRRKRSG